MLFSSSDSSFSQAFLSFEKSKAVLLFYLDLVAEFGDERSLNAKEGFSLLSLSSSYLYPVKSRSLLGIPELFRDPFFLSFSKRNYFLSKLQVLYFFFFEPEFYF